MPNNEPSALEKSEQKGASGSGKKDVGATSKPCPQLAEAATELKFEAPLPAFEAEFVIPPPINFEVDAKPLPAVQFEVGFAEPSAE